MPAQLWGKAVLIAVGLATLVLAPGATIADSNRDRTISFYGVNTKETLTIQYMKNGKHIPEAMEKINWMLRDWRKDEATKMDPDLIDLVWEIHNELGSAEPINIISGYRSHDTNEFLRRTVGGQASQSRHILGKAMDVTFPDVPVRKLRYSALIHERGGVGYYPTSATPFVHIDTDRVRAWPRATRMELALLFPNGRTQHVPDDGSPLTPDDVRKARAASSDVVQQIAEVQELRSHPRAPMQIASLAPSLPQLLGPPRPIERPLGLGTRPTDRERAALTALSDEPLPQLLIAPAPANRPRSATAVIESGELRMTAANPGNGTALGRLKWDAALTREPATFVPAPAYDEEHPEELSYRPFPIAPFLTNTASVDDPALARMVHPDFARTLEMLDQLASGPPMRLRPGSQTARVLWAQEFRGEAINLSSLIDPRSKEPAPAAFAGRRVHIQPQ